MDYFQHLLMRSIIWVAVIMLAVLENGCNGCLEKERIALLQLKHSINIPNRIDRLPSWEEDDSMDCCHWEGVECNSTTHRVIKLELYHARDWRTRDDYWHLNASILLPFESLQSLNLSQNLLHSFVGNEGIGMFPNFSNLEELDLSYNYLDNTILPSLNKLSNLKLLRSAGNDLNDSIYVEGIGILSNLTNLEELDLSLNYLGNGILPSLNKLSNLKFLRLANTNLNGSIFVKGIGILSNLTNLEELDLRGNYLGNGILSSLNNFSNLKNLNLADTNLNGSIYVKGIRILSNLTNLEELDLSDNYLGNDILLSLNKLSNLKFLRLAWNHLNGSLYVKEFDGLNNLKELDLSNNAIASISALNGSQEESGILKKLEVLDLSDNEALNNSVWSFLGGLSSIKTLDLSYNRRLHGAVHNKDLRNISNIETLLMDGVVLDDVLPYIRVITSIQVLSLTYCDCKRIPSIEGLCDLKKLRELDVTGSDFGETLPWCLANLTSLRLLDLTSNHFTGNIARSPLISLTSLEYLAISDNNFEVPISFMSFFNHSKLMFIESLNNMLLEEDDFPATSPSFQLIGLCLSNSKLGHITRSFPHFLYDQHDLILVKLSHFTGKFPYWLLDNNTRMETLILSYNSFDGPLLLPSRHMRNLIELDISNNHLEGFLPYKIAGPFPSLEFFNMSTNNFEGNIPSSFGDMTSLQVLDLSNNRLSGKIPVQLAKGCASLRFLSLSTNNLTGPILPHQNNLTTLAVLYSNNNGFTEIPSSLSRSTMLIILDVSANQLVGKIPVGFIGNLSLWFLAMAGNHLEGPIPIEFCQLKDLYLLDLSENNITGTVPSCFSSSPIYNIRLSKNRLDGPFPMALKNYSTNLMELDLSYNQFSGNIPTWIGSFSNLAVLLLQHNHFEGNIRKVLCNLSSLTMIDLSFNNLSGSIPPCISRIEFNGMHSQSSVFGIGVTDSRHIFKLLLHDLRMVLHKRGIETDQEMSLDRSTKPEFVEFTTKGMSLFYKGIVLDLFSGINLSHNRMTGPIPPEIANLSHIKVLNLSHNNFTGTIPVTFSNLKSIESLDLSYNHLHGKIPSQLTILNFLVVFNLSFNNLSGRMPPRVNQFGTFESSSYIGNPLLCGEPLPRKCNANDSPPRAAVNNTKEDSGFMDMDVFYMSFVGSYVTVVLAIVAILWINPYWRRAWFRLVEVFITSFYYFVVDNLVWRRRGFIWK